jgi:hypothetical protein
MKEPLKIGTIIPTQVYTVPGFTNLYGTKVDATPVTIKIYNPSSSFENGGVMPESLLKTVLAHYEERQDNLTVVEDIVKQRLEALLDLF